MRDPNHHHLEGGLCGCAKQANEYEELLRECVLQWGYRRTGDVAAESEDDGAFFGTHIRRAVSHFRARDKPGERDHVSTGGLAVLETIFLVLGLPDPCPVDEIWPK